MQNQRMRRYFTAHHCPPCLNSCLPVPEFSSGMPCRASSNHINSCSRDNRHAHHTIRSSIWAVPNPKVVYAVAAIAPQELPSADGVHDYGLSAAQNQQLEVYLDFMLETNKVMNLTAVRDKGEARVRHIQDSLTLLPVIDKHLELRAHLLTHSPADKQSLRNTNSQGAARANSGKGPRLRQRQRSAVRVASAAELKLQRLLEGDSSDDSSTSSSSNTTSDSRVNTTSAVSVIDVGTGAGLPGMVLAVARPQWKVTLLDTLRKRCDFLREAAQKMGLQNVEVVWSRAEEAGKGPLRQSFDVAVARAVAETRVLAELCIPLVRVGGVWIAPKGPNPQEEVLAASRAVQLLGGSLQPVELVDSFSSDGQRTAVVVYKDTPTPKQYPRQPGTPNSKPL